MMKSEWKKVKLGEVLHRADRFERRDELVEYPFAGTYSYARGIFVGERKLGSTFGLPKIQRIKTGDFVYCKIMAWEGAFGLVPQAADGCVLSGAFVAYEVDKDQLDPLFLDYYFKTPLHWQSVGKQSTGTNVRRQSLHPSQFEQTMFPLPPLAEQQRIVARIEELASQIEEARTLRKQAIEEVEAMLISLAYRADLNDTEKHLAGWQKRPLRDCIELVDDSHKVLADRSYPNLGIYSYARGLFHKQSIEGIQTSAPTLRRVRAGQFIYSRLFAFEGAYGRVTEEYDGHYVSSEYPTFNCNSELVKIEFLEAYFKSRSVWREVAVGSKGLGVRRQRVQPAQILSHSAWIPPLEWQEKIAAVSKNIDTLKPLHAETAAELDALMPALLDRAFKGEL
jgi:type I restriction enzyme S subunit